MSKLVRSLALMTALAALSVGTVSVAQDKGKTPPTAAVKKADKAEKKESKAAIEYYKNVEKGTWRFKIIDDHGKTFVIPLPQISYESKEECLKAIEALKKIMSEVKPTEDKSEKKK